MIDLPQKIAFYIGCFILIFSPLAFGTVHPWAVLIFKSAVLLMLLISVYLMSTGETQGIPKRRIDYTFIAFIFFVIFQLIPIPTFILKLLSPERWALLFDAFKTIGISVPKFQSLTVNTSSTQAALSNFLFYLGLYFSLLIVLSERRYIRSLSRVVIGIGFLIAFIAIAQKFSQAEAIYWTALKRPKFYGTFVNPNHCAVFISSIAVFTLVFFLKETNKLHRIAYGFLFAIMSIAVLYSLSRGGMLSFLTSVILLLFLFFKNTKAGGHLSSGKNISIIFVFILIVILVSWWGTFKSLNELSSLKDIRPDNFRIQLWKNTLQIFSDFFILGTGLGTFSNVIPVFRTIGENVIIEFSENDYLQLLSEVGLVGFLIISYGLLQIVKRALKITLKKFDRLPRAQLGATFGLLCIAANSMGSFNVYIPGIMILATVFLAMMFVPTRRYGS